MVLSNWLSPFGRRIRKAKLSERGTKCGVKINTGVETMSQSWCLQSLRSAVPPSIGKYFTRFVTGSHHDVIGQVHIRFYCKTKVTRAICINCKNLKLQSRSQITQIMTSDNKTTKEKRLEVSRYFGRTSRPSSGDLMSSFFISYSDLFLTKPKERSGHGCSNVGQCYLLDKLLPTG